MAEDVKAGVFEEALALLAAHRRELDARLLSELAGEVAVAALDPTRFPSAQAVQNARLMLAYAGMRDERCDHILADRAYQTLHLWPTGHTHALDVLDGAGQAAGKDRFTGLAFGPAACGKPISGDFIRADRGDWKRAAQAQEGAEPGACCIRCRDFAHDFPETAERWPTPVLGAADDAAVARRLAAAAPAALAHAFDDKRTLWAVQDALVTAHHEVVLTVTSDLLAKSPGWQVWRMLGPQAVPTLKQLKSQGRPVTGQLTAQDWRALLEGLGGREEFRERLAARLLGR